MWISKRLAATQEEKAPESAKVTGVRGGQMDAVGAYEYIGVPSVAPYGFFSLPEEGESVLVTGAQGFDVCLGIIRAGVPIGAGEILLQNAAGASIHLKNDGSIELNGLIITSRGELISP